MLRFVALLLLAFLALPVVSAQAPLEPRAELSMSEDQRLPNGRLMPETGQAIVALELTARCATPPTLTATTANFRLKSTAPYASVIFNPPSASYELPAQACVDPAYRYVFSSTVYVTTTRRAPALASFVTELEATLQDENGEYGPYAVKFTLVNEFLPLTVLNPATLFVKADPGTTVTLPVDVHNLGNGPVRVSVNVSQPNKNKLPSIDPGGDLRLESRVGDPSARFKATHDIVVKTPPAGVYMNDMFSFNVRYDTTYDGQANGSLLTDAQAIAFAVQVQGGAASTPSPGLLLGFLAVVCAMRSYRPRAP